MHRLRLASGLRLRPVPELGVCLAYLRRPPRLLRLNLEAWALLEVLAASGDGADQPARMRAELAAGGWHLSAETLSDLMAGLEARGLVERLPEPMAADL